MLFPTPSFAFASTVMLALCCGPWSAAQTDPAGLACNGRWPTLDFTELDNCRPKPVTDQEKQSLLASLPGRGEVRNLNDGQKRKLSALDALLALHARNDVYVVKVIDVPQAWTGLYGRGVLLISAPLLKLVSSGELQALVAHEIGHEYTWAAWNSAQAAGQKDQMHQIELTCDAIAFVTLQKLGEDPMWLISALERVAQFNRGHFGDAIDQTSHPPLRERREVVKHLAQRRENQIPIVVSVFNRAGVDQASILEAEQVAAKIYEQAGISIEWQNCRTQARAELERCKQTAERGKLVLNVERQLRAATADAFGVAFLGDDGWGAFCDIFYDRILELHHDGRASEAIILGAVMAHELGHLLLGPDAHSATGIMRPQLHFKDFLTPEFGTVFSQSQVQKIQERWAQVTSAKSAKAMITTGAD